ncbi:RNA 2',3'-cyclic phosphodiesterase [Asanoa siamensis]|uniref:RNA 2',3'-cyclic phosphodiesterase n=1 Tax=Asanoa siamensis TaxID=926357 RepID=A0ABQ4CY03_9ACTN|nr:RNA 2',3'-cyclic phosphodiesterase [Asanoa siamensis]GIF76159.1 RNA 2',3'-cyclic phosphodiesterase [Asanoa siamensis]
MRLFVAAYPAPEAVANLATFVASLRVGRAFAAGTNTRLARPETYHLTLAFLGDVADERLADVETAIGRGVDGYAAQSSRSVPELALAGGGRFGRGAFTLMWVGVTGDLAPIRSLHRSLRRELKRARFPYDERPWKPHLTIARPGDRIPRVDLNEDRESLNTYAGPTWPVTEILLMRSHLGPNPTYERLTNWLL